MSNSSFIDARKLIIKPFSHPLHPEEIGDSGLLEFAVSKADSGEQYIIKRGNVYPEVACNEFMYHRVTSALGMYTQDVMLIIGSKNYRRSAAIRYAPNAKLFNLKESSQENLQAYFEFEALSVILNESDSHEYYLDEQGRLFKLDNAASFTVEQTTIMLFDGNPIGHFFIPDISAPLNAVGYSWYSLVHDQILQKHGEHAARAYLSAIRRFSEFDETALFGAYKALEKQYPAALCDYYNEVIRIRKGTCREFLGENDGR